MTDTLLQFFTASGGLRYVGQCLYQMCRQGGYTSSDILLITVIAFAAAAFKHTANTHLLKFSVYQIVVFFPFRLVAVVFMEI